MEWSAQHPYLTTRNRTREQGGKKAILHIRDSLFEHVNKKGLSRVNMGKSIKSECVIQILSRSQKHEQVLKFPTHILSAQSGCVTAHKWFDAAWGPAAVGGRIIFSSLQWPWPADWAVPFSPGRSGSAEPTTQVLAPRIHTFHALFAAVLSQHSSRQSAWRGCELLPASYLIPKLWFLRAGLPSQHKESKEIESKVHGVLRD